MKEKRRFEIFLAVLGLIVAAGAVVYLIQLTIESVNVEAKEGVEQLTSTLIYLNLATIVVGMLLACGIAVSAIFVLVGNESMLTLFRLIFIGATLALALLLSPGSEATTPQVLIFLGTLWVIIFETMVYLKNADY